MNKKDTIRFEYLLIRKPLKKSSSANAEKERLKRLYISPSRRRKRGRKRIERSHKLPLHMEISEKSNGRRRKSPEKLGT
ncbi:MAG: hypothetical protein ACK4SM_00920 [Aquificaceae bacterium]